MFWWCCFSVQLLPFSLMPTAFFRVDHYSSPGWCPHLACLGWRSLLCRPWIMIGSNGPVPPAWLLCLCGSGRSDTPDNLASLQISHLLWLPMRMSCLCLLFCGWTSCPVTCSYGSKMRMTIESSRQSMSLLALASFLGWCANMIHLASIHVLALCTTMFLPYSPGLAILVCLLFLWQITYFDQ